MVLKVRVRKMEEVPECLCRKARQMNDLHCQSLFLWSTPVGFLLCRTCGFSPCVSCWRLVSRGVKYWLDTKVSRQNLN